MDDMDWENWYFFVIFLPKLIRDGFAGQKNMNDFWNISAQEWRDDQEWADNNLEKWYHIDKFGFVRIQKGKMGWDS